MNATEEQSQHGLRRVLHESDLTLLATRGSSVALRAPVEEDTEQRPDEGPDVCQRADVVLSP